MSDADFAQSAPQHPFNRPMNGLQSAALGVAQSGHINNKSLPKASTPHSPTTVRSPTRPHSGGSISRKRTQDIARLDGSPESAGGWEEKDESRIGVKRACNECRQQKVSHSPKAEEQLPMLAVRMGADRKGLMMGVCLRVSCGVMSCKSLFRSVRDVDGVGWSAGSIRPSRGLASGRRMRRWRGRLSS